SEPDGRSRAIVQRAGSAYRLERRLLQVEMERNFKMTILLLHHARYQIVQAARAELCTRHHTIEQQLCHWLLLSLDRVHGGQVSTGQQLIANILGVHREGVTQALAALRRYGAIATA